MPRSSRHKSHKQSKHSSKETRDYSDSGEDVKMKESSSKEESSARASRDSAHLASGEKRKLAAQSREGKEGKDLNGDAAEDYGSSAPSKRRKEKAEGIDRWNGGGDERAEGGVVESLKLDLEKHSKSKEVKGLGDSKAKSSKRHDEKDENVGSVTEKEENKGGGRIESSKRRSEKDSGRKEGKDSRELKEKERGSEREKKGQESRREYEVKGVEGDTGKKQGSQSGDNGEERQSKRGRENTEWTIQNDSRFSESEKEVEKRIRRKGEGSSDRDRYEDELREGDDRRMGSRSDRGKDEKYRDERHKDSNYGDKDDKCRDEKYREDVDRDSKHREDKYKDDGQRETRRKDEKYREESDRDSRRRDDRYSEDGERDNRRRDDKSREDSEREARRRDEKYRDDGERDNKRKDDKYREDGDRDSRRSDDRYREDVERDDRQRQNKYREDSERDSRRKEEKYREDFERDSKHRDGKQGDDIEKEKKPRETKYKDERASRDRSSDKSDIKRLRDDSHAADIHSRKSSAHEGSPSYDDNVPQYKDEQGRRRVDDKEDHGDNRSRSTKDQRFDAEKRYAGGTRADLVVDRGRSTSRNADVELASNYSRRRSSPGSSSHYRHTKQEESKYRDYIYEERVRHNVTSTREYVGAAGSVEKTSSSRSLEKLVQKEDSYLGDISADRRLKSDNHNSPLQLVDKSPSSTSTDRRQLGRSEVRRSLDIDESAQRSGGSRDAKDFSGKDGRGSREFPIEPLPGDEVSQADGDNLSVSSPFTRSNHLPGSSKTLLPPPPPFRSAVDSPLIFGLSEDDSRGKSSNRHRRTGESNMGRMQGNAWKGVPNWPSPIANGFMPPFQHGPPPVGFHPVMQQFPGPPIFGVRPSMELNHPGFPYHIPDADRFAGHGRPMGWRNPVEDSCPPPMHSWDGNNALSGDETHLYARPDWDHNRPLPSARVWETGGEMWKGPNSSTSMEQQSASKKEDYMGQAPADEAFSGQSVQQAQGEKKYPDSQVETNDISQSSDAVERSSPKGGKTFTEETSVDLQMATKDDTCPEHFYISKLDISEDLALPEFYHEFSNVMVIDQDISDIDGTRILYVEEVAEAKVTTPTKISSASLFAAINDSIFQKAISLYKKERDEIKVINGERISFAHTQKSVLASNEEKLGVERCEPVELACCDDQQAAKAVSPISDHADTIEMPASISGIGPSTNTDQELEEQPIKIVEKSEVSSPSVEGGDVDVDMVPDPEMPELIVADMAENVNGLDGNSPTKTEELMRPTNSIINSSGNNSEEQKLLETKCGPLLISDVSSEACEVVMPESIASGLVNLSRIHHSPESTH